MLDFKSVSIKKNSGMSSDGIEMEEYCAKDIAVIGISVKFPKADTLEQLWDNLSNGIDCIGQIPTARRNDIENAAYFRKDNHEPLKYPEGAYLDEIDKFDYKYFKLSPKEASLMDPNQRLFLENAWKAIEDAGYGGNKLVGSRTGVFVGFGSDSDYKKLISEIEPSSSSLSLTGNIQPIIASRLSYYMDFRGPSMIVNTTCSSSLVALHLACMSIRNNECELALAGGVQVYLNPVRNTQIGIESSCYRTKTFDDSSDGTGAGEGIAAVLLKPYRYAVRDGDNIYAIIKGSSINHDGSSIGITAPNAVAQEDVIVNAWKDAEIDPETIRFIETHGTGTKLGDPIEIDGIKRAFERYTNRKQFCSVSSIKTNIGHLDSVAGIAGFIKAVLCLKYRKLAPSLHFNRPNRKIHFDESPVYILDKLQKWESTGFPRRCGVSSFGLSGTNCHIVLEEAPMLARNKAHNGEGFYAITFSAKSKESLQFLIKDYLCFMQKESNCDLDDICYTANTGRGHYNLRLAIVFKGRTELISILQKIYDSSLNNVNFSSVYLGEHKIIRDINEKSDGFKVNEAEKNEYTKEANKMLYSFISEGSKDKAVLDRIFNLYVKGADIDWEIMYRNSNCKKVSLPTYTFERTRCWLQFPKVDFMSNKNETLFHVANWVKMDISHSKSISYKGTVIIFKDIKGVGDKISSFLKVYGAKVVEIVNSGNSLLKRENNVYMADISNFFHIKSIIEDIRSDKIVQIIFVHNVEENENNDLHLLDEGIKSGVYSFVNIVKVLTSFDVTEKLDIALIAKNVNSVTKQENEIQPESAALFGVGMAVSMETPQFNCRCIDIDQNTDILRIMDEIKSEKQNFKVAYRHGVRYVENIDELDEGARNYSDFSIDTQGAYIITGGMGYIGLEFARHLSEKGKAKIALIGRRKLPEYEQWDRILKEDKDKELSKEIQTFREILSTGTEAAYYSADVSKVEEISLVLDDIRKRFGKINAIFHSAGVGARLKGRMVRDEQMEIFKEVLLPKVTGTWVLDYLTKSDNLDFFALFSSAIVITGGMGSGHYIAANCYLDSFAAYRSRLGKRTLSINWAPWLDESMTNEIETGDRQVFSALTTTRALSAFDRIINQGLDRIIIGKINYNSPVFKLGDYLPFKMSERIKAKTNASSNEDSVKQGISNGEVKKDVCLKGKDQGNYTEIEKNIASIWRDLLEYQEINVYDNFFEIGGDSIIITKVHSKIEEIFPGKLTVADLFAYPTISKLAEFLALPGSQDSGRSTGMLKDDNTNNLEGSILNLFEQLKRGNMSIDDASTYFEAMEAKDE